jgi:hypothetical protein
MADRAFGIEPPLNHQRPAMQAVRHAGAHVVGFKSQFEQSLPAAR